MIGNLMYCLTLCTDELCTNNTFEASVEKESRNKESNYPKILNHFSTATHKLHRLFCNQNIEHFLMK